jgi:hypothetical protein
MAWLSGYLYKKEITVSNADNSVTWKLIGKTSDAVGEDVDCNGHCLDTFYDLRFTESDGTTIIPHYRDSVVDSGGTKLATVAIKNTTETTAYMYYGKADATDSSSGANTFTQFDDFEWGNDGDPLSDDGGGIDWTITAAGSSKVEIDTAQKYSGTRSARLYRDGTNAPRADFPLIAGEDYAVRFRVRKNDTMSYAIRHGNAATTMYLYLEADEDISVYDGATFVDTGENISVDTWTLFELNDFDWTAKTVDIWKDGVRIADDADVSYSLSSFTNIFSFVGGQGTAENGLDDVIVYKWSATPQDFAFGSEEEPPSGVLSSPVCFDMAVV